MNFVVANLLTANGLEYCRHLNFVLLQQWYFMLLKFIFVQHGKRVF